MLKLYYSKKSTLTDNYIYKKESNGVYDYGSLKWSQVKICCISHTAQSSLVVKSRFLCRIILNLTYSPIATAFTVLLPLGNLNGPLYLNVAFAAGPIV